MSAFDTKILNSEINIILSNNNSVNISNHSSMSTDCVDKPIKSGIKNKDLNETQKSDFRSRPHTLEDFKQIEVLQEIAETESTLNFNELNDDEEIWVMDIPKTIDPMQLKNQILQLGNKSKLKIGEDRYCAENRDGKSSMTCVFRSIDNNSRSYQTVNIKPVGTINVRRKLSKMTRKPLQFEKSAGITYPQNIKIRHPFFGVEFNHLREKNKKYV